MFSLLQSLKAQKRTKNFEESNNISDNSEPKSAMEPDYGVGNRGEEVKAESKSGTAEKEVNVIHNHVNLKIRCSRRAGQLEHAIVTLESLRLTVLHLNITTSQASVLYSFNLKMEEDSKLRLADEIAASVHQILGGRKVKSQTKKMKNRGSIVCSTKITQDRALDVYILT